jgi:ABC-type nitrate/sulfonate/bicarbonate transport system permease component
MSKKIIVIISTLIGVGLIPIIWLFLHYYVDVGERFLPSPVRVFESILSLQPNIIMHTLETSIRFIVGSVLGIISGIFLGLLLFKFKIINRLLAPSIQAIRAVPPIATIPFFLLWFGFSEIGRYLLVVVGIGFNITIATYQILNKLPEKYKVFFKSFPIKSQKRVLKFSLPVVLEKILPTVRFSLSTAIGLVIVSELLGAQVGLGYLIQVARATFSLEVVFLATMILGLIMVITDKFVVWAWKKMVFWEK